ncbi:MAG: C10 family peptidase [Bacteroidetes bacterium]|nr:C10 family peptidase [Bacteroidota bacterium]
MRKIVLFVLGILFFVLPETRSNPVDVTLASLVAKNAYLGQVNPLAMEDFASIEPQLLSTKAKDGLNIYYVFGFTNHAGWVIVSGSDHYFPVLGYSDENNFPLEESQQSPEYLYWMSLNEKRIQLSETSDSYTDATVIAAWEQYLQPVTSNNLLPASAVAPLLTTKWAQGCNYNSLCPSDNNGPCNHVVTGCVATAMAQVMKYWNFPGNGSGTHTYTDPDSENDDGDEDPSYGDQYASFSDSYNWWDMPNEPDNENTGIPELMRECGVSVDMDYSWWGSSAYGQDIPTAMSAYFYYNFGIIYLEQDDYEYVDWVYLLEDDLDYSMPILYGGQGPDGGHRWVCDGYQSNYNGTGHTYFHMNWGWGGSQNGYFRTVDLTPGSHVFDDDLNVVCNIFPMYLPPIAPTDLWASQGDWGGKIYIDWHWASNAGYYRLYRSTQNNFATASAITPWQTACVYVDEDINPLETYYYWVRSATSATGDLASSQSDPVEGYTSMPDYLVSNYMLDQAETPDYYYFTSQINHWSVLGIRPATGENWDISAYNNNQFNFLPVISSTYGAGYVDLVAEDGHHLPDQTRGVKVKRASGDGSATLSAFTATSTLAVGSTTSHSYNTDAVVACWDVDLDPGTYQFSVNVTSGSLNPGIALFTSLGGNNPYSNRSTALALSDANGNGGDESFSVVINNTDIYGFAVFSSNGLSGSFSITITRLGTWTGAVNHDWNNAGNWSGNVVPSIDVDVTIPPVTNRPWIMSGNAECKHLIVEAGTGNYLRIYNHKLTVYDDAEIYGSLMMDNAVSAAVGEFRGDVYWGSGSSATMVNPTTLNVYGNWTFASGSLVHLNGGTVNFYGSDNSYVYSNSTSSYFYNIWSYKTGNALIDYSGVSDHSLTVKGDIILHAGSGFYCTCDSSLILYGGLYDQSGKFCCTKGSVVFKGSAQTLSIQSIDYFNNLVINPTVSVNLDDVIHVRADLIISTGLFNSNSYHIYVGGDWTNHVGASGFTEGSGRVIFDGGNYAQYSSTEVFNELEINKTEGGVVRVNGGNVQCSVYDWTAGGLSVLSGSFTALSLQDYGIAGAFFLQSGGTIELHNTSGPIDLNGSINISGGTFNVYGGTTESFWPYLDDASITMSAHSFAESITGGLIRTSGSFRIERSEFFPTGGKVEMYGSGTRLVSSINGGEFYDLKINRDAGSLVNVSGGLKLYGNLELAGGTLASNNLDINIRGNWTNTVGDAAFTEGNGTVTFDNGLPTVMIVSGSETFYNLSVNKSYNGPNGVQLSDNSTLNVTNDLSCINGVVKPGVNGILNLKDVNLSSGGGINCQNSNIAMNISGDWNDNNTSTTMNKGFYHGTSSTVTFVQSANQNLNSAASTIEFYHLVINKPAGNFNPFKGLTLQGDFSLQQGIFNYGATGLNHIFNGNYSVPTGTTWNNGQSTINFNGTSDQNFTFSPSTGTLGNVNIEKPASASVIMLSNISSLNAGNLVINGGELNLNGHQYICSGDLNVNDEGLLYISGSSTLEIGTGKTITINNGGTLQLAGGFLFPSRITHQSGYYGFNLESGSSISAHNAIFEYMNTSGVNVKGGAWVDPDNAFNNCRFRYGQSGGTLLVLNNSQTLTVNYADFPTNTWSGSYNVSKTAMTGLVNFVNATGGFSGEDYDYDLFNKIIWTIGSAQITGNFRYDNTAQTALNNTKVYLKSGTVNVDSVTTGTTGQYTFTIANPGTYSLGSRCTKTWGGVNATDALMIMRHFVGLDTLQSVRFKAGDVDATNYVNTIDALLVMKRYVGIINTFAIGDWVDDHPSATVGATGITTLNLKGLCSGDVNVSYIPPAKQAAEVEIAEKGMLDISATQVIDIPLQVTRDCNIGAISLTLAYPENQLDITDVTIKKETGNLFYHLENGKLLIAWSSLDPLWLSNDETLLTIHCRLRDNLEQISNLQLFTSESESELADALANPLSGENLTIPRLIDIAEHSDFILGDCYPNPFSETTTLPYWLPERATVVFNVTDILGRMVYISELGIQDSGSHSIEFNRSQIPDGTYFYTLKISGKNGEQQQTRSMVILR